MLYDKTGKVLLYCPAGREGDVSVPDGVETIGYDAFSGCTNLVSVVIPESVTNVSYLAFSDCTKRVPKKRKTLSSQLEE